MTTRVAITLMLASLALAPAGHARPKDEAAFKLRSASGTQTHTFHERTTDIAYDDHGGDLSQPATPYRTDICTGTQSQSIRYRTTKPTKMYVSLREAHGLHTLVSGKPDPDSGLDYLSTSGEMTASRAVDYQVVEGCELEPVACPETTFLGSVLVFGNHEPSAGITPAYDTNVDLPSGLPRDCDPVFFPAPPRDLLEFLGVIPRSEIFGKKKRLSGQDSFEFSYEEASDPGARVQKTVYGTFGESIAVELKRLKPKR